MLRSGNNIFAKKNKLTIRLELEGRIGIAGVEIADSMDFINYLQKSCAKYLVKNYHPHIMLDQPNSYLVQQAREKKYWGYVEDSLVDSVQRLKNSDADFVVIPDSTINKVLNNVRERSSLYVINMLDVLPKACLQQRLMKIGIIGTQSAMIDPFYRAAFENAGIQVVTPHRYDQQIVLDALADELIPDGKVCQKTEEDLLGIVESLKVKGCDGIVVASTNLARVLNTENCGLPMLDPMLFLADAVVERAVFLQQEKMSSNKHAVARCAL